MSALTPETRRITFDYEITAGKAELRVFKHEKDFERLYFIPSKQVEDVMLWRLTVKPEANNKLFNISSNGKTPEKTKKLTPFGGSPGSSLFPRPSCAFEDMFNQSPKDIFNPTPMSRISLQINLLNITSPLKDSGLKTSLKVVFRDKSSIQMLTKNSTFNFSETERIFELSLGIEEFDVFENEIIVKVEITILDVSDSPISNTFTRDLSNDLSHLLESKQFTDMTLVVDDGEFKVHRGILAARSPVFSAMFDNKMKEGLSGTAVIEDLDKEVLNELLYYIYSGRVKNLKEFGPSLLVASDKYNIPLLKEICEDFLSRNLTTEMACEELILADIHDCKILKPLVIDFIIENAVLITKTTGWKNIIKSHPFLVAEMFEALASSLEEKEKVSERKPELSKEPRKCLYVRR